MRARNRRSGRKPESRTKVMASISATAEHRHWFDLVDDVCKSHTQVLIRGQRGNAVLVSSLVLCQPRQPKPSASSTCSRLMDWVGLQFCFKPCFRRSTAKERSNKRKSELEHLSQAQSYRSLLSTKTGLTLFHLRRATSKHQALHQRYEPKAFSEPYLLSTPCNLLIKARQPSNHF